MTISLKWIVGIILVALVGLGLYYRASKKEQPLSTEPIKVGVAVGQTGVGAEWGADELRAVQIAFAKANETGGIHGRPLRIIVEDTRSDNVGTANAFTKLVNVDKVPLIIGPTWGDSFQSGYEIAKKANVVVVGPSVAVEVLDRSLLGPFFATWWPQLSEVQRVIGWMKSSSHDRAVQVYDQDAFNTKFSEIFAGEAEKSGVTIAAKIIMPVGDHDFRTRLAKVKDLKPTAFFVELQDVASFGPFMKQMKELGFATKVVSTATTQNEQLLKDYGTIIEGLVYSYPAVKEDAAYQNLVATYKEQYGVAPAGPSFVNAYNAALAVVAALKDQATTGASLNDALRRVDIPGVGIERIAFGETGQVRSVSFMMKTVKDGKFVKLED